MKSRKVAQSSSVCMTVLECLGLWCRLRISHATPFALGRFSCLHRRHGQAPAGRRSALWYAAALWWPGSLRADQPEPAVASDVQLKAAYLHKFPGFVEWPLGQFATSTSPFVVGVVGNEPVYTELLQIARGRLVQGRPVELRRVAAAQAAPRDLHLVFIGKEVARDAPAGLEAFRDQHVVTVTEAALGLQAGAILNFVEGDGRVRFEASLIAADRAGIKLSARLLSVAVRVVGGSS